MTIVGCLRRREIFSQNKADTTSQPRKYNEIYLREWISLGKDLEKEKKKTYRKYDKMPHYVSTEFTGVTCMRRL